MDIWTGEQDRTDLCSSTVQQYAVGLDAAALFINDCNWCKWTSRRLILSIEKSCFRGEMRLPCSLAFFPCSGINFPCFLINRETACKALLLWYDSEPNQQKTANIDPKRTFFPVNSLLTGKMRRDWLARDCLHCQTLPWFLALLVCSVIVARFPPLGVPRCGVRRDRERFLGRFWAEVSVCDSGGTSLGRVAVRARRIARAVLTRWRRSGS